MLSATDRRHILTWKSQVTEICAGLPRWWGEIEELESRAWVGILKLESLPDPIELDWLEKVVGHAANPMRDCLSNRLLRIEQKINYTEGLRQRQGVVDPLPED